jgi:hypothetical protein
MYVLFLFDMGLFFHLSCLLGGRLQATCRRKCDCSCPPRSLSREMALALQVALHLISLQTLRGG